MAAAKPSSVAELFAKKNQAKKKPKPTNLNADKPPEEAKPVLRSANPEGAATEDGWERELRRDLELLKACGLRLTEVEADGACLFRAFADQLAGSEEEHSSYRERCVDYMRAHRPDFEPFLEEDFEEYCARMREPTAWGGHVEAQALASCMGVNALIYQPAEAGQPDALERTAVEILTSDADDCRCVQLSFHPRHHHGQHYNSVRYAEDDGAGPAPPASVAELRRRIQDALAPKEADAPSEEAAGDGDEVPKPKARSKTSVRVF